jgi:hypothetical protein
MREDSMTLPVPVFDHVVVNVRERMDEAEACYRRLGFTLTARGFHTLGSINHLAVFGTDYLELIGLPRGGVGRRELMDWPVGLNGLVFATEDADALHAALREGGVSCGMPQSFSRPVALADGTTRDAVFRTVRLPDETTEAGRLYFCAHATRDLVWRDEWRRHANGALGVARAVIATDQPDALAALFARLFGAGAVARSGDGYSVAVGLAGVDIVSPIALRRRYGMAAPEGDGRGAWMAALELRTGSLAMTATALHDVVDVRITESCVTVPAAAAMGVALSFLP